MKKFDPYSKPHKPKKPAEFLPKKIDEIELEDGFKLSEILTVEDFEVAYLDVEWDLYREAYKWSIMVPRRSVRDPNYKKKLQKYQEELNEYKKDLKEWKIKKEAYDLKEKEIEEKKERDLLEKLKAKYE